jgi:hypothetical protein
MSWLFNLIYLNRVNVIENCVNRLLINNKVDEIMKCVNTILRQIIKTNKLVFVNVKKWYNGII